MNRLQKKCVIATAGFHLLLILILVFGSAFFAPRPKPDDMPLLDVIPSTTIDALFNSGKLNATPPAPQPVVNSPLLPTPPPPVVQPTPQPVEPPPKPVVTQPTLPERLKEIFTPERAKPTPPKPPEKQTHQINISTQLVARVTPKNTTPKTPPRDTRAITSVLNALQHKLSSPTEIDMPGDSTVAYANYASVVKSIYDAAWTLPDSIANDVENVKVTVTITRDGTVISSRIIEKAGDAPVDNSVQRTLDRVSFIAPFPDGATDKERTYTINFNPKAKRTIE